MSLFRDHAWAGFGFSAVTFWIGAILLVWFGGGSDLAVIGASQLSFPLKLGVGLMLVGVGSAFVVLNERSWALEEPLAVRAYLSAGVWVASTAALTRVSGWLDVSFGAWSLIIDLLAALALVIGSLIVLSSSRLTRLCQGFMLAQAGLALVAIDLGVEARSPLLLHLACGTVPLVLSLLAVEVPSGRAAVGLDARSQLSMDRLSRLVFALCWLSFTSLPPFPGFTAKFPILVALAGADKARVLLLLLLTTVLLAVGWTRWMSRLLWAESTVSSPRPRPGAMVLAALALAATLALGVLPETAIEVASRAAAGLF
jgi:NADH:ubiquinone oxidoreductase subunit 2 (subunit N)